MTVTRYLPGHFNPTKKTPVIREDLTWSEFIALAKVTPNWEKGGSEKWKGGTMKDMNRWLEHGDLENAKKAQDMLEEINTALDLSLLGPEWGLSPVGGTCSVGAYLAGSPANMRRMTEVESDHAPINLYVGIGYSASFTADQIMKRGLACLALAMALARVRPVKLWAYDGISPGWNHQKEYVTQIEVPLNDVGAAATVLTRATVSRNFCFTRCGQLTGIDSDALRWPTHTELEYMQPKNDDILVTCGHTDHQDEILKNPVKWVEEQLHKAIHHEGLVASTYRNDHDK